MSFLKNIVNSLCPNNITITTRPYNINNPISGYNKSNNYTLQFIFTKGISIGSIKTQLNKYKSPNNQIKTCYINGFKSLDTLTIDENTLIYIST